MKWSQIKRVISLTLCALMVLSLLPTITLAEDTATPSETSVPSEATQSVSEESPAAEATETPVPSDSAEATPAPAEATPAPAEATETPTPSDAAETPAPSETPTEDIIPEGPQTYVVNFVIDGQTIGNMQQTVAEGDLVTAPGIPAVPDGEQYGGQVFLYWYVTRGTAYKFSTPVTSDLVLYAMFGETEDAPAVEEEPIVADDAILFSAFSVSGGIIPESVPLWTLYVCNQRNNGINKNSSDGRYAGCA
jgi:hypothetical protein